MVNRLRASSMKLGSATGPAAAYRSSSAVSPLQGLVEGQRVHEHRPRDVGGVGRQALMLPGVDVFGQRPVSRGDVVGDDGGHEGGLSEAGHDLLPDRLVAGIDVMQMNRRRVGGPCRQRCAMVRASSRSMPRTRWKLSSVAVLPVSVSRTCGCSG